MKTLNQIIVAMLVLACAFLVIPKAYSANGPDHGLKPAPGTALDQYYRWLDMGKKALPELKAAVKSDNWKMRTHALLAMGKLGDQSLIPIVLDRLNHDDNVAVKNCAVVALGDLKAVSTVPLLLDLLNKSQTAESGSVLPEPRLIVQSLGKIKDPRAVKPLHDLLLKAPQQLQWETKDALISIGDPEISRLLLADSKDSPAYPRRLAAEILGELPVDHADDYLIKLVSDPNMPVKNAAVIALGKMKSQKSVPVLINEFKTNDSHFRQNIADALIKIDSPKAVQPICAFLSDKNQETAMTAAFILSQMSSEDIGDTVFEKFKTDHSINAPAAYVLGRKEYAGAIPLLRKRLKNQKETGSNEMAEALGMLKDRESIDLLISVAKRKNLTGSVGAIWALGYLKAEKSLPDLLHLLKKRNRQLTMPLIFALGNIGDPSAVKPLVDLYYGSGLQYQQQIALSLAMIGGPEVRDFIKTNMESGNRKREHMAGFILLKSTDKTLLSYVITLLDHPDEVIRRYAMGYLINNTGLNFETEAQWKEWAKKQDHH